MARTRAGRAAPRQDLLAALSFLDAVDTKVAAQERERFERLRDEVRSTDDGQGLPEALLHGNLLHAPDHAILTKARSGRDQLEGIRARSAPRRPGLPDLGYRGRGTHVVRTRSRSTLPSTHTADTLSRRRTSSTGSKR